MALFSCFRPDPPRGHPGPRSLGSAARPPDVLSCVRRDTWTCRHPSRHPGSLALC